MSPIIPNISLFQSTHPRRPNVGECPWCLTKECGCPFGVDRHHTLSVREPISDAIKGILPAQGVTRSAIVISGSRSSFQEVRYGLPDTISREDKAIREIFNNTFVADLNGNVVDFCLSIDLNNRTLLRLIPATMGTIREELNQKYAVYLRVPNFRQTFRIAIFLIFLLFGFKIA